VARQGFDGEAEMVGEAAARLLATATCRWSSPGRRPPTTGPRVNQPGAGTGRPHFLQQAGQGRSECFGPGRFGQAT
jgi:hypothetical protein